MQASLTWWCLTHRCTQTSWKAHTSKFITHFVTQTPQPDPQICKNFLMHRSANLSITEILIGFFKLLENICWSFASHRVLGFGLFKIACCKGPALQHLPSGINVVNWKLSLKIYSPSRKPDCMNELFVKQMTSAILGASPPKKGVFNASCSTRITSV